MRVRDCVDRVEIFQVHSSGILRRYLYVDRAACRGRLLLEMHIDPMGNSFEIVPTEIISNVLDMSLLICLTCSQIVIFKNLIMHCVSLDGSACLLSSDSSRVGCRPLLALCLQTCRRDLRFYGFYHFL